MDSSNIKIIQAKCPSYLSSLLNSVEDIILVYKASDPGNESYYMPTPVKCKNEVEDYLDITGSPLKVDLNNSSFLSIDSVNSCTQFWNKNEEKYCPLPYDSAHKHIQEYLDKNYKNQKEISTWWILDGSDENKTILMSALQMPTYISRSTVTLQGFLPKTLNSIEFEALCNKHFEIIKDVTGHTNRILLRQLTTHVSCSYELRGSKIQSGNIDDKSDNQGSVYLNISWNQCRAEIPRDHSKCIMTVQTIVGQQKSELSRFWNELLHLELYIKTLNEYNSQTLLESHWLPTQGVSSDDSELVDRIIHIIQNSGDAPQYVNREEGLELANIIENVDKRQDRDITDELWDILNKCSDYGALTNCLNIVFTEIINRESSVFIADSNITSIAQIIRDIVSGKTSVFMLTGTQPIEILIDIGLEKLRKDFINIFSQFEIVTEQELRELFNIPSRYSAQNMLNNDSKQIRSALYHKQSLLSLSNLENRMKTLGKLHTILETLILVPSMWQPLSSKAIYEHYMGLESPIVSFFDLAKNKAYEIDVELPASKVVDDVKTLSPAIWKLSLTFTKPSFSVKNVFHFSQLPIFPPMVYIPDPMQDSIVDENVVYYHHTLLTQITNYINRKLV